MHTLNEKTSRKKSITVVEFNVFILQMGPNQVLHQLHLQLSIFKASIFKTYKLKS